MTAEGLEITRDELVEIGTAMRREVPAGARVLLADPSAATLAACILGLEGWASVVEVGNAQRSPGSAVVERAAGASQVEVLDSRQAPTLDRPTRWRLYSSGTTGQQHSVDHRLDALHPRAALRLRPGRPLTWGLLYPVARMGGVQVVLRAIAANEGLVDVTGLRSTEAKIAHLAAHGVDALSATPTLCRRMLLTRAHRDLELKQITLGGEIADQPLIDRLRLTFGARVTHVYASTEAGTVLSVSDGLAGFPKSKLAAGGEVVPNLVVRSNVLYVYAPASTAAGTDGYVRTDDLVEIDGERVYFRGRASGIVNVGGQKVSPEVVESAIREMPFVQDVLVQGRENALTGSILVASVVNTPGARAEMTERYMRAEIRRHVAEVLSAAHAPAHVRFTDKIEPATSGKLPR